MFEVNKIHGGQKVAAASDLKKDNLSVSSKKGWQFKKRAEAEKKAQEMNAKDGSIYGILPVK